MISRLGGDHTIQNVSTRVQVNTQRSVVGINRYCWDNARLLRWLGENNITAADERTSRPTSVVEEHSSQALSRGGTSGRNFGLHATGRMRVTG